MIFNHIIAYNIKKKVNDEAWESINPEAWVIVFDRIQYIIFVEATYTRYTIMNEINRE